MNNKHPHLRAAAFAAMMSSAAAALAAPERKPNEGLDLDDDTPLPPACDLSGDGACDACQ